jgi:hypothetical protein
MTRIWRSGLLFAISFLQTIFLYSQSRSSLLFADSLTASADSYFLYNLIGVRSTGRTVSLAIHPPAGWKLVGAPVRTNPANGDSLSYFPITLIRQSSASAEFTRVGLQVKLEGVDSNAFSVDSFFYIRANAVRQFSVSSPQSSINIFKDDKKVLLPVLIRNRGTTSENYHITVKSPTLTEALKYKVSLRPGVDSLCSFPFYISRAGWKGTQKVLVSVADETDIFYSIPFTVSSLQKDSKVHATPFADFPANLEVGIMLADKQLTYYGAARASWSFPEGNLDFSFRSKLYGFANTLERNYFSMQLNRKKLHLSLGQLSATQHFFSYGRGAKAVFTFSPSAELGTQIIFHTLPGVFTNNSFSVWYQKQKASRNRLYRIAANFDTPKGLQEYLFFHENEWVFKQKTRLTLMAAVGWEQFLRLLVSTDGKPALGGGYRFVRNGKLVEWISNWQQFPRFFPGIEKGLTNHQHQFRWIRKDSYIDLFYTYNRTVNSILTDTIYYTDAFRFNIEKGGIRMGYRKGQLDFSFSTGLLAQTGLAVSQLPRYQFGEVFFSLMTKTGSRFSFKSLFGYADNQQISSSVFISNTTISYQRKGSGIRAFFLQQPLLKDSTIKVLLRINRTLLVSPFISFKIGKQVGVNLRYSASKTRFDRGITSSAALNASWRQPATGWELAFSGTFPFSRSAAPSILGVNIPFFTISVKKALRVPLFLKKRYHRLSVVSYEDVNSNKHYDSTDRLLPGIKARVNKEDFMTGADGSFHWRNIDTGYYQVTLTNPAVYRGLLPPPDAELAFTLQADKKIMIPFSKSCVVSGVVRIELDDHSTQTVSPEHVLVKAIDSTGKEYATLTNEKGSYFINLPAGQYTVTLNPEAYHGTIKPVTLFFRVDLRQRQEEEVNFLLREKKRPVRLLKQ